MTTPYPVRPEAAAGVTGVLCVETIGKIRRRRLVKQDSISGIARDLGLSRNTVKKALRSGVEPFEYRREHQPRPQLGPYLGMLEEWLAADAKLPLRERRTAQRLYEGLRLEGYVGAVDSVRRHVRQALSRTRAIEAFIPLSFAPGEAYQFDWSHEVVLLNGVTVTVKVAHVRLCHSRMLFVRAYPRETQEMVFDAHDRAFALFKGTCGRGIYDNMKTAVETIFVGKERLYNRRFLQMCSHYLVDPVACTPASGWEKGQVENQVGLVRERFFTPRLRFKSYDELNAWLLDKCIAYAKAHRHPELTEQTIWEVFEARTAEARSLCRPVRRIPRGAGVGLEDLPGALRQQQILGGCQRGRAAGRGACLCRPHRDPPGRAHRRRASALRSAAARRSTIPGITCRCWPASPAPCATARPSRTGCCRPRWTRCGASSPAPTTAIGRWSTSSRRC